MILSDGPCHHPWLHFPELSLEDMEAQVCPRFCSSQVKRRNWNLGLSISDKPDTSSAYFQRFCFLKILFFCPMQCSWMQVLFQRVPENYPIISVLREVSCPVCPPLLSLKGIPLVTWVRAWPYISPTQDTYTCKSAGAGQQL